MNVDSLRSGANKDARNEIRVAKVGLTLTTLFLISWTPYFAVACIGTYGNREILTPFLSMIPACTCKLAACIDPFVFAINHPKYNILLYLKVIKNDPFNISIINRYRLELQKKMPWLCVHEPDEPKLGDNASAITNTASSIGSTNQSQPS